MRYWQPWNEPNLDYYLSPQWVRSGRHWVSVGPDLYRGLLNAFYSAVKRVSASNVVLMGGTAPYGDQMGSDRPGQERTPPVDFYRGVFCLPDSAFPPVGCPEPAHLDAVDHHPYGVVGPYWHALNSGDVAVPDIYKISRVLAEANRAGHLTPSGAKPIWVGEIGWSSSPPNPGGVPLGEQARWYSEALKVLWGQGVRTVLFLELADPPTGGDPSAVFESGLYFCPCYRHGAAKPAAAAYRFPFVARRVSRSRVQVWGRAPETGPVEVQARRGRRWVSIRRVSASSGQVFQLTIQAGGGVALRAKARADLSLTWLLAS